jgi:hypothetical protein
MAFACNWLVQARDNQNQIERCCALSGLFLATNAYGCAVHRVVLVGRHLSDTSPNQFRGREEGEKGDNGVYARACFFLTHCPA